MKIVPHLFIRCPNFSLINDMTYYMRGLEHFPLFPGKCFVSSPATSLHLLLQRRAKATNASPARQQQQQPAAVVKPH